MSSSVVRTPVPVRKAYFFCSPQCTQVHTYKTNAQTHLRLPSRRPTSSSNPRSAIIDKNYLNKRYTIFWDIQPPCRKGNGRRRGSPRGVPYIMSFLSLLPPNAKSYACTQQKCNKKPHHLERVSKNFNFTFYTEHARQQTRWTDGTFL